jgi:hypothetical protein
VRVPAAGNDVEAAGWVALFGMLLYTDAWNLLWGILEVLIPLLAWLALCRLAPWPQLKSKWVAVGLLGAGIAIGCWPLMARLW